MENTTFVERLLAFGLTRQEAAIYQCLLSEGKITGYEVAKQIGISRSNAYNSLASLTDKGGAYLAEEGTVRKYVPVPLREFCRNYIHMLEESRKWLAEHMPETKNATDGYITIEGARHILDKMRNLLKQAEYKVYISCTRNYLLLFVKELEDLITTRKKVVIITDHPVHLAGARVYLGEDRGVRIGLIVDSEYVIAGEYGEGSSNNCLYSGQKNFLELYERALANEIKLLALREENQER